MNPVPIAFKNARGLRIAADHYPVEGTGVVVMANDLFTHKRWRGRYPRIAADLNAAGISALAFDYCGSGESEDEVLRPQSMIEDVRATVGEVRRLGYRRVALWGHGQLSGLCIDAQCDDVATMVLSAAATAPFDLARAAGFEDHELAALHAKGVVSVSSMDPSVRPTQTLDDQLFQYFAAVEQGERLGRLRCPVLLINGNHPDDVEECRRLAANRTAVPLLPSESRVHVIEGARHSFADHLDALAGAGVNWLKVHLGS